MYIDTSQQELQLVFDNLLNQDDNRYQQYLDKANKFYSQLQEDSDRYEPRPYQPEMAALYALRANNICSGSCGLGKTIIVGLLICIIFDQLVRPGQVQIAVPSLLSANSRWLVDLKSIKFLRDKIEVINSEKQLLSTSAPILVYTHDFIKRKSKTVTKSHNQMWKLLKQLGYKPSLLVIDEVHLLKPRTDRTKQWEHYRRYAKRFIALSGTLSDGRLKLIYHVMRFVYGQEFNYTFEYFMKNFGTSSRIKTNYLKGSEVVDDISTRYLPHLCVTKLAEFSDLSQRLIHRVTLNDPNVASTITIPTYTNHEVTVIPTKEHRMEYEAVIKDVKDKLSNLIDTKNSNLAFRALSPLMQASAWPNVPNKKMQKLAELVNNCDGKTVIFGNLVQTTRIIYNYLYTTMGNSVIRLYANDECSQVKNLPMSKREELLSKFLYDPKVKVGVFSINLAAESIDLNVAKQVIFYDYTWQSLKIQQAIHRAVRPGSPVKHVDVYYLVNHGMIDQHQYSLIKERMSTSKIMLDFDPTLMRKVDLSSIDFNKVIIKTLEIDPVTELENILVPDIDFEDLDDLEDIPF